MKIVKQQYGYRSLTESDIFELFCIYCIASKYIKHESITKEMLDDIKIGNGGDWGIDGLFVVVNGQVVFTKDAVDDLLKANGSLAVQIVAIQAKTSSKFIQCCRIGSDIRRSTKYIERYYW